MNEKKEKKVQHYLCWESARTLLIQRITPRPAGNLEIGHFHNDQYPTLWGNMEISILILTGTQWNFLEDVSIHLSHAQFSHNSLKFWMFQWKMQSIYMNCMFMGLWIRNWSINRRMFTPWQIRARIIVRRLPDITDVCQALLETCKTTI